jgi:hypothetical protein
MPIITEPVVISSSPDDADYYNGVSPPFNSTRGYLWVGEHTITSYGPWAGLRFMVPAHINPNYITNVILKMTAANASMFDAALRVEQGNGAPFTSTGSDRPDNRFNAITSDGQVRFHKTDANTVAGTSYQSPDFSERFKDALTAFGAPVDGFRVVVVLLGPWDRSHNHFAQLASFDSTVYAKPTLEITSNLPSNVDATVTPTAPGLGLNMESNHRYDWWKFWNDVSYHDGIGNPENRVMDIHIPPGTPPANGWPVLFFTHGGAWAGPAQGEDTIRSISTRGVIPFISAVKDLGYAIVSVRYKLTQAVGTTGNVGWCHPAPIQDTICAAKFIKTHGSHQGGSGTLALNGEHMIAAGYSAGGNIALETALVLEDPNRDSYTMAFQGLSTTKSRFTDFPIMDMTQGRTSLPSFKGVVSWAGPVSLSGINNIFTIPAVNTYLGGQPVHPMGWEYSYSGAAKQEGDLNRYMLGTAGTIYEGRTPTPPNFPILYIYDQSDTTVPMGSGLNPLINAVSVLNYPMAPSGLGKRLAPPGNALSTWGTVSGGDGGIAHDTIFEKAYMETFVEWMEQIPLGVEQMDNGVTTVAPKLDSFAAMVNPSQAPIGIFYYDGSNEIPVQLKYVSNGVESSLIIGMAG